MGYMGLSHWCDSDNAADLRAGVIQSMARTLKVGLKETDNCYNTDGCVNVALILEDKKLFGNLADYELSYFKDVAELAIIALQKKVNACKKMEQDENIKMHSNAYKRMIKSLKRYADADD